ncbi:MAG TPA: peptidyl-prolyl cis-trans isomerase [Solirubrobacteraceae bacterium]|nr:peptidyl-prolyl cis-trans isomerase [Solirubrobacteraceae bacterium]
MKPVRVIAALGAVLFSVIGVAACGSSGVPSDAVVQVNGQPITKATFDHWLGIAASASAAQTSTTAAKPVVPEPPAYTACIAHLQAIEPKPTKGQKAKTPAQLKTLCETQYKELQQQVLGYLISLDWIFGAAEEQGVHVSDSEVVKHFNALKKESFKTEAAFQSFLAKTGESISDVLLRVKYSMVSTKLQEKLTKAHKNVSEAEVAKYFNEHKAQYGQPERRDLRVVLTKTEAAAKQAKSEIESGKSFASVAKSKSIDPTSKSTGGELPGVVKGEEQKALSEAVFAAKQGTLTGPVKTPFGYYIFEVKATHPASQQTLAQVKTTIKQQLASQGSQKSLETFSKELQKKWRARTECRSEYLVKDCKSYKAPKTAAGAAGAAGAASTTGTE